MGFLCFPLLSLHVSLFKVPRYFTVSNHPPVWSQGHGNDAMLWLMHLNSGMELDAYQAHGDSSGFVC